jgi:hypothetical protein
MKLTRIACLLPLGLMPLAMAQAPDVPHQDSPAGPATRAEAGAIQAAEFGTYLADLTTWLGQQTPAQPTAAALAALLEEPGFGTVLAQRQLLVKLGTDPLGGFAKAAPANRTFLAWLLKNRVAMELYLEGAVPIGLAAREKNDYTLSTATLEIWRKIFEADPESTDGLWLKLAIATALAPPGSGAPGAGHLKPPADPVSRYLHYKTAQRNGELFPSFDHLTVWEYQKVVQSGASNEDLAWGRALINTWRPDLRADEMVVNSTSFVWRRNSPHPYTDMRTVLSGGGKCGPRSSWAVFICQAFGIPAIGVGQPAHACVAYKAANPLTEPQPGSAWKVGFGRGWEVSKLEGLRGPDFLAGVRECAHAAEFARVEHLRWLAAALTAGDRADAVMAVAHGIQRALPGQQTDLTASLKPDEAEADPGVKGGLQPGPAPAQASAGSGHGAPLKAVGGVIHVPAAAFVKTGGEISWGGQLPQVLVHDCLTGGKQVFFQQQMKSQWADYAIEVPAAGIYQLSMTTACINADQVLEVGAGPNVLAKVAIPLSYGLWQETRPVPLQLAGGIQTLRIQTPTTEHKRGIALRGLVLKRAE